MPSTDRELIATLTARGYIVRRRTKPEAGKALIYPLPVYVATFAGGEATRFSIHAYHGKPLPFERGRAIAAQAIANERGWAAVRAEIGDPKRRYLIGLRVRVGLVPARAIDLTWHGLIYAAFPPVGDQVAGHIEVGNVIHPDPGFLKGDGVKPQPEITFKPQPLFQAGGRK